ncbi:MAG: threonine--tRNA ligase [Fimbriimonadaceae bacterium]|nr:threonine--tRNA ligase [Fimbriimonadaceae bacterium]QYK57033.1 MAG: threonine--tRNA ligase [Fimbriimonadaceae bacterium]
MGSQLFRIVCGGTFMSYEQSQLYKLRHSAAHLMAQAVTELYPGAKLSIGPPIENGFYYDIEFPAPIKEEELERIEGRMRELAKLRQPIVKRLAASRDDARRIILEETTLGQGEETALYKLQLLDAIPEGEEVSFYEQKATGKDGQSHLFIDLCRGPHVENTGEIKHFKLMSIAGAYWRGDVHNKMLTRLYGTAFETAEDLEAYLYQLEEAKKRDHRVLGRELGLFMFSPVVGQGLALWLPKGATLREVLTDFLKEEQLKRGYKPVVTPNLASIKLYEKSGHIQTYRDKMFPFMEDEEKETFVLKPMNCPFHIEIYASALHSYRDLPIRYAEFGTVYRYEQSGELAGMLRVRGFTQDDAHLFVRPDQLLEEFKGVVDLMLVVLDKLGLKDYRVRVGTRDTESDKYVGHDENWKLSESAIVQACDELGLEYEVSVGDAAFYGPKLDLIIKDALGREWQMGTVQVDYNLPERFDLEYIGEDSKPHRPIMIHRAPFGSLERMIGLLTEQYAGAFPYWMAPVQVMVLPIADRHNEAANEVVAKLREQKVRAEADERRETLGKKIRENQRQKVPYMLVLGDKDIEAGTVSVRSREEGDLGGMTLEAFLQKVNG